jgi:hypothetical protein
MVLPAAGASRLVYAGAATVPILARRTERRANLPDALHAAAMRGRVSPNQESIISGPHTTTSALPLQSLLRLHAPHNALVLDRCAQGQRPRAVQL